METEYQRKESDPPLCSIDWGWQYHHLGVPTQKPLPGAKYLPDLKFRVSGFSKSPFGIEWMNFDEDSPVHPLIQSVPHLAFEVSDIEKEVKQHGLSVISQSSNPMEGVKVVMIEHNGAPIELIEFDHVIFADPEP